MIPSPAVEALRSATDERCRTAVCCDSGCSLELSGVPNPYILVNLESAYAGLAPSETRCDYLFVGESDENGVSWLAPIELTTGRKRAARFFQQLKAGAAFADKRLPQNSAVKFRPIAAHSRLLHPREYALMRAYRVPFRNEKAAIKLVSCGSKLADALGGA